MNDNRHGYKAYNPGLVCRGYRYKENEIFKKNGHGICVPGVTHYCVNPFDVLEFYPLVNDDGKFSDFTTVEAIDEPVSDDNKKFATSTIKIGAKLGLDGFVKACVDFLYEKTIKNMPESNVDSGDDAVVTCEADFAVVACVGQRGKIKAPLGTWITLAEYGDFDGTGFPCKCVKSAQIDGEVLKANTFYTLKNGEFVEPEQIELTEV